MPDRRSSFYYHQIIMARGNFTHTYHYCGQSLRAYCKSHNLNYNTIRQRIHTSGWQIDQAVQWYRLPSSDFPYEERREVKWYEWFYDVSNYGRVRTYRKTTNWTREVWEHTKLLNPWKKRQTTTYATVTLFHTTKRKQHFKVCRLVAQAFLWLDYNDKYTLVCHKDDNGMNNHIDNLFLWTHKDNTQDSISKWRCKLKWLINK